MPFTNDVFIRAALRADYKCEICGESVWEVRPNQESAPFNIHSATTLHLVRVVDNPDFYEVTSPPTRYLQMRGGFLPVVDYKEFKYRGDDGYCLCHKCHRELHKIALCETKQKFPRHIASNSAPDICMKVTLFLVNRGKF